MQENLPARHNGVVIYFINLIVQYVKHFCSPLSQSMYTEQLLYLVHSGLPKELLYFFIASFQQGCWKRF